MARKRADLLLVERGLFESRARARAAIEAGGVTADGRVVLKASEALDEAAEVVAVAAHPWVGRGALKLVHALETWPVPVEGRTVLDVGASTGASPRSVWQGARRGSTPSMSGEGSSMASWSTILASPTSRRPTPAT